MEDQNQTSSVMPDNSTAGGNSTAGSWQTNTTEPDTMSFTPESSTMTSTPDNTDWWAAPSTVADFFPTSSAVASSVRSHEHHQSHSVTSSWYPQATGLSISSANDTNASLEFLTTTISNSLPSLIISDNSSNNSSNKSVTFDSGIASAASTDDSQNKQAWRRPELITGITLACLGFVCLVIGIIIQIKRRANRARTKRAVHTISGMDFSDARHQDEEDWDFQLFTKEVNAGMALKQQQRLAAPAAYTLSEHRQSIATVYSTGDSDEGDCEELSPRAV